MSTSNVRIMRYEVGAEGSNMSYVPPRTVKAYGTYNKQASGAGQMCFGEGVGARA